MKERDLANRFSHDVDDLLKGSDKLTDTEPYPAEYDNVLNMASTLSSVDFSSESEIKDQLRQQLMEKIAARVEEKRAMLGFKETVINMITKRRRPIMALSVLALTLICVELIFPAAIPAAAQSIGDFVDKVVLRRTVVTRIHSDKNPGVAPSNVRTLVKKKYEVKIGEGSGNIDQVIEELQKMKDLKMGPHKTLADLEEALNKKVRVPAYLPKDFKFTDGMALPGGMAILNYDGPNGHISIEESPASDEDEATNEVETDQPIKQVSVNGEPACWIDNMAFTWETDDTSYTITAPGFSLDDMINIAESIR
jgi:hypothetical protein